MSEERSKKYRELLNGPEWHDRRLEIISRDGGECTKCGYKDTPLEVFYPVEEYPSLQVHHLYYKKNKNPWEYPDDALTTLCSPCHIKEHPDKPGKCVVAMLEEYSSKGNEKLIKTQAFGLTDPLIDVLVWAGRASNRGSNHFYHLNVILSFSEDTKG